MGKSPNRFVMLSNRLKEFGLLAFGVLTLDEKKCGVLIGNAGPDMWQYFSRSQEYGDGQKDPMNRWTKRVVTDIANTYNCQALYPFDRPYPPFQNYAIKAMGTKASPLGMLIHPEYGLWHAFRSVLVFDQNNEIYDDLKAQALTPKDNHHPCDACRDKPCLSTCPVNAFTGEQLLVADCFKHLDSADKPDCLNEGCAARLACPIGNNYNYSAEQIAFHMRAYRG